MTTRVCDLEPQALQHVFSYLTGRELATASTVCQLWRSQAAEDVLWRQLLENDWHQRQPVDPQGQACATSKSAYASWAREYLSDFASAHISTALKSWTDIKAWLSEHFPEVLDSLQPAATPAQIEQAARDLGHVLPAPLAAIYRIHNGQALWWDTTLDVRQGMPGAKELQQRLKNDAVGRRLARQAAQAAAAPAGPTSAGPSSTGGSAAAGGSGGGHVGAGAGGDVGGSGDVVSEDMSSDGEEEEEGRIPPSVYHGMFGGYCFYDHLTVTRMLPLERAVWWTKFLRDRSAFNYRNPCLVFAASYNFRKLFVVDLIHGTVCVSSTPALLPAAPEPAGCSLTEGGQGTVLSWFSEYARRLREGWYIVAPLDLDMPEGQAISLFPRCAPGLSEATTRGVCVSASSVFVPEASRQNALLFTYSIRMSIESVEEQQRRLDQLAISSVSGPHLSAHTHTPPVGAVSEGVVRRCQLMSRHWRILDGDGHLMDEVAGEGVIGKFPILDVRCDHDFSYQSCTQQRARRGHMEGMFRFVEGVLSGPQPYKEFDVVCPRFTLEIPDYMF